MADMKMFWSPVDVGTGKKRGRSRLFALKCSQVGGLGDGVWGCFFGGWGTGHRGVGRGLGGCHQYRYHPPRRFRPPGMMHGGMRQLDVACFLCVPRSSTCASHCDGPIVHDRPARRVSATGIPDRTTTNSDASYGPAGDDLCTGWQGQPGSSGCQYAHI